MKRDLAKKCVQQMIELFIERAVKGMMGKFDIRLGDKTIIYKLTKSNLSNEKVEYINVSRISGGKPKLNMRIVLQDNANIAMLLTEKQLHDDPKDTVYVLVKINMKRLRDLRVNK